MTFVQVVPIRRMPADRPWLTYRVPDNLKVGPGSLVTVPLRSKPILGVVWKTADQPQPKLKIQEVQAVHLSDPILTAWQLRVCQIMADVGSTSLGDVLFRVVPKLTARNIFKLLENILVVASIEESNEPGSFLWYRTRSEALNRIDDLLKKFKQSPVAVITPTISDAEELVAQAETIGRIAVHIHGQLAPTDYAQWYKRILSGEPIVVIGGLSALTLPFQRTPLIILDQEEHHAHKQTAQFPFYDARIVLTTLQLPYHITTPAPSISYYHQHHPPVPTPANRRTLISLHGPKQDYLVSDELLTHLDEAHQSHQSVVCISPRRGFASYTSCKSCGTPLICPKCGRSATIFRGLSDEARCRSCQTLVPQDIVCRKCGSTAWSFRGFGVEQTVASLKKLRPELNIVPVIRADVSADIAVDTYQSYRVLRTMKNLGKIIVVSGDSLLTSPDYSVAERAWQFMARLQAESDTAQTIVQTWQPESPFWQRWLHGDDAAWYSDELRQRQRLSVPPFSRQWICSYRESASEVDKKIQELRTKYHSTLEVQSLTSPQPRAANQRLLITFNDPQQSDSFPWTAVFPLPWHLDRFPISWLD